MYPTGCTPKAIEMTIEILLIYSRRLLIYFYNLKNKLYKQ